MSMGGDVSMVPGQPSYLSVAGSLQHQIEQGTLKPDQQLPTQTELSVQYEVSQATVNRAIELLRAAGFVRAEPGVGVFVQGGKATGSS